MHEKLASEEVQEFIGEKLRELRKRLLDSSRRNPLVNIQFRPTSTSILRVVDELPDILRFNLTNGKAHAQRLPDQRAILKQWAEFVEEA